MPKCFMVYKKLKKKNTQLVKLGLTVADEVNQIEARF